MKPLLSNISLCLLGALAVPALIAPALARPGKWGGSDWKRSRWDGSPAMDGGAPDRRSRATPDRSREGRVSVNRFVGESGAAALGHGTIAIAPPGAFPQTGGEQLPASATYEAAVIDRLVHAGYDTAQARSDSGQTAELRVTRSVVEPAEAPRKPVSGEAAMSVGNRGMSYGLSVAVDLSQPLPPLVSTRLETRIRDRATGNILWEGRAEVATREGDARWTDQAIAASLSEALFDGFPLVADASARTGSSGES
jgi:hypothetical protein